jgi:hypothetical protein
MKKLLVALSIAIVLATPTSSMAWGEHHPRRYHPGHSHSVHVYRHHDAGDVAIGVLGGIIGGIVIGRILAPPPVFVHEYHCRWTDVPRQPHRHYRRD